MKLQIMFIFAVAPSESPRTNRRPRVLAMPISQMSLWTALRTITAAASRKLRLSRANEDFTNGEPPAARTPEATAAGEPIMSIVKGVERRTL